MSEEMQGRDFRWLYRAGGYAILAAALVFRRFYGVELMTFQGFGLFAVPEVEPVSAAEWFGVLRSYPYAGLSMLGLYDMVNYVLVCVFFLAVGGALRDTGRGLVAVCIAGSLLAAAVYLSTNRAFPMLLLSGRYAAAAPETRSVFLAAGEAHLAVFQSGSQVSLHLLYLAGLGLSIRMLKSDHFQRITASAGILANAIGILYYPMLLILDSWSWLPPALSAPFRMAWYVLAAFNLLRLARRTSLMKGE